MLLAQTANPEGALAVAKKRLGLKDNAHNRFFVAKVYEQRQEFDAAGTELHAGLKAEPADILCKLGLAALLLKREDAAALTQAGTILDHIGQQLKEGKTKDRWQKDYLLLRGLEAGLHGQPDKARQLLKQLLALDKNQQTALKALDVLENHEPSYPQR